MEKCPYHDSLADSVTQIAKSMALLQKDVEYLRRDQETILSRFGKHVEDADKDGGWHNRIQKVEEDLRNTKIMGRWFMIGSGVIGGLIGAGATDAVVKFLGMFH